MANNDRVFYGFIKNEELKITTACIYVDIVEFCNTIVNFCKSLSLKELNEIFDRIIMVIPSDKPTFNDIQIYGEYATNNKQSEITWFSLLYKSIGNIDLYKNKEFRHMISQSYAYRYEKIVRYECIIDLDTQKIIIGDRFLHKQLLIKLDNLNNINLEDEIKNMSTISIENILSIKRKNGDIKIEEEIDRFKEKIEYIASNIFDGYYIEIINGKISFDIKINSPNFNHEITKFYYEFT